MLHHCPFQNYIALFSPPTQFFLKAIQSWPDRHFIKFLQVYKFFSLHGGVPHLKYPNETNAPPLPFPKLYYTFFSPHPNFFYSNSKLARQTCYKIFVTFTIFFPFTGGSHILNSHTKQMLRDCPFQDSITLFTPPTQIFFISIQSWRGTRDIKFSSLYNFFLFIGGRHILNSDRK